MLLMMVVMLLLVVFSVNVNSIFDMARRLVGMDARMVGCFAFVG